ncbi:non-hydrolyzing UDP-N-acetylglucosamine 2-epimerase [Terribacillus sp. DMT04]|uniref:non-hydrolyzing UDP-N-acetylglucosamine 2-epimerase n=1 Tax=Terribacillus sp. DMT04 TaxID=2850441 RepID=UPI001C2BDC4E|nr:UDP-N-acetylglucosamine 2-epimerase (non-hydrolyzing) [Terribacillus sp. DMT04]QXE03587.1 UDP-N-acetylglucosamine 2-epimerase (non-hydrolyzing) [Terribacillus sp. DMT04]
MKIAFILGTRPEGIKLAPVIQAIRKETKHETVLINTGQHEKLINDTLQLFSLESDYNLKLMSKNQRADQFVSKAISAISQTLDSIKPDLVFIVGDTASTFAAAFSSFHHKVPIVHIEAGLRTNDIYSPFPEEAYRQLVTRLATYHFAPTQKNKENLLAENILESKIQVVGNPVIDALHYIQQQTNSSVYEIHPYLNFKKKILLLTTHRRENFEHMNKIYNAILEIVNLHKDVEVVFPAHPNPNVQRQIKRLLNHKQVHVVEPMDYVSFSVLMKQSYMVVTDSGGIQEEAPAFDIPVIVVRNSTERTEGMEAGTLILAGTESAPIIDAIHKQLIDPSLYNQTAKAKNPYGDGQTSTRIVNWIEKYN